MLYTRDGFSSVKWSSLGAYPGLRKASYLHKVAKRELKTHTRRVRPTKTAVHQIFFSVHIYMYIYLYKYSYIYIWSYDYTWFLHILKNKSLLNRGFWHLDCAPLSTPGPGGEDCRWLGCCSKGIQHGTWVNDMKQPWWVSNNMYK